MVEQINLDKDTELNNLVQFVPTPIGNLRDISLRALDALSEAQIIFCEDTRVTKKLLNLLEVSLDKKFISMHSHNEINFNFQDIDFSKNIVYVSDAGMPIISDPGIELLKYCQDNEIEYDVLPGANALLTALVGSGIESREFTFFGFLPHKGNDRSEKLKEVMQHDKTAILYESPHRIEKLLSEMQNIDAEREVCFCKELTKIHQTYIKDSLKNIKLNNTKGEWVVIISPTIKSQKLLLDYSDIMELGISTKEKAKLLSKITGKSSKEIYKSLLND